MALIVQKFGGTSVANTERIFNVADIVTKTAAAGNQVVVVVSAQGDTTDDFKMCIRDRDEAIKTFGTFELKVKLYPEVVGKLKVQVTEAE